MSMTGRAVELPSSLSSFAEVKPIPRAVVAMPMEMMESNINPFQVYMQDNDQSVTESGSMPGVDEKMECQTKETENAAAVQGKLNRNQEIPGTLMCVEHGDVRPMTNIREANIMDTSTMSAIGRFLSWWCTMLVMGKMLIFSTLRHLSCLWIQYFGIGRIEAQGTGIHLLPSSTIFTMFTKLLLVCVILISAGSPIMGASSQSAKTQIKMLHCADTLILKSESIHPGTQIHRWVDNEPQLPQYCPFSVKDLECKCHNHDNGCDVIWSNVTENSEIGVELNPSEPPAWYQPKKDPCKTNVTVCHNVTFNLDQNASVPLGSQASTGLGSNITEKYIPDLNNASDFNPGSSEALSGPATKASIAIPCVVIVILITVIAAVLIWKCKRFETMKTKLRAIPQSLSTEITSFIRPRPPHRGPDSASNPDLERLRNAEEILPVVV